MSSFWNKPKSLYDIADELANRLDDTDDESGYPAGTQLADNSGGSAGSIAGGTQSSTNPSNVNAFFDSQYDRISQLANDMNVPPNLLLGLSAYESGWGQKNNLFGLSVNEKPLGYSSPDASVDAFRNSQWFSRLSNKPDANSFVDELVNDHGGTQPKFNSKIADYDQQVLGVINSVNRRLPIWQQSH